jgi:hypothetical protein
MYRSIYGDVDYLPLYNAAFVTWKKFCRGDDYRNVLRHAVEVIAAHPGCNYIADTRNGFENEDADTGWVFNVFAPEAHRAGCRHIFFIIDQAGTLKKELEGQTGGLKGQDGLSKYFGVHTCYDITEVSAIIEAFEQAVRR